MDEPFRCDRVEQLAGARRETERNVAAGRSLARRDDVRSDRPGIDAEPPTVAPEPGHHLVRDQHDAVGAADLCYLRPIVLARNVCTDLGAGDRLGVIVSTPLLDG